MKTAKLIPSVTELRRADISLPADTLRETSPLAVGLIVQSVQRCGAILQPLIVQRKKKGVFELVDGRHRNAAAKLLQMETVPVLCFEGRRDDIRQVAVDANLARSDLSPLDRAKHMAEHKQLYLKKHPETAQGTAGANSRWNASAELALASYAGFAATQFGIPKRSIYKLIEIGEALSREDYLKLSGAPKQATVNDLLSLSKADPEARSGAIEAFARGDVKKLSGGLKSEPKQAADPVSDGVAALASAWRRAPQQARLEFVQEHHVVINRLLSDLEADL